jgi:MFS family permease
MQIVRLMRLRSGVSYGMAMAVAAAYCAFLSPSGLSVAYLVAALSTVSAAAIGYGIGGWYVPVEDERPGFELVAAPVLVSILAPFAGATILLFVGTLLSQAETGEGLWVLPAAVAMTLAYFALSWPVALVSFAVAAAAMARYSRRGSNHSFKPTPSARLNSRR